MASETRRRGRPRKLSTVVAEGDLRASLEALRDSLARAMDEASAGAKAQTAAQLRAVLADIAALPQEKKATKADELAAKRAARLAEAAASVPATGAGHK